MKVLPYYIEDEGAKCSSSISLMQSMNVLSEDDSLNISAYMESCVVIDEWLSNIKDPITGRFDVPSKTWSDGEYIWDSSHIHYVRRYRARLPDEFVRHVKNRIEMNFDVKSLNKDTLRSEFENILEKLVSGDESFYVSRW